MSACRRCRLIGLYADSLQPKSLPTATSELHALLALPALATVPLLVLANKNDLPEAISVDDLIKEMRLSEIRGRAVSVSRVSMMSHDSQGSPSRMYEIGR